MQCKRTETDQVRGACSAASLGSAGHQYHAILLLSSDGFWELTSQSPLATLHVYNETHVNQEHVLSRRLPSCKAELTH